MYLYHDLTWCITQIMHQGLGLGLNYYTKSTFPGQEIFKKKRSSENHTFGQICARIHFIADKLHNTKQHRYPCIYISEEKNWKMLALLFWRCYKELQTSSWKVL